MISDRLSHLQSEVQKYYKQMAGREKAKQQKRRQSKSN
jgi:hypothetical protein